MMPEGDTVLQTAARLHQLLAGDVVVRSEFRVPQLAKTDLSGWLVREAIPVGKHLLIRLRAPVEVVSKGARPTRDFTLHSHLMMDGMWRFQEASRPRPRDFRVRAMLETARVRAYAEDVQGFELVPTRDEATLIGHLGPDLLHPSFSERDVEVSVERILARSARSVSSALMDQRNLAGIGNIYRNETMFLIGLRHGVRVGDVAAEKVEEAVRTAHRLLDLNKFRLPRSTTGLAARGRDSLWVYVRAGRPCRRCGERILVAEHDDSVLALGPSGEVLERDGRPLKLRWVWWCPSCQRG